MDINKVSPVMVPIYLKLVSGLQHKKGEIQKEPYNPPELRRWKLEFERLKQLEFVAQRTIEKNSTQRPAEECPQVFGGY